LKSTLDRIAEYEAAETACLKAQQYSVGDTSKVQAQLRDIRAALNDLYEQLAIEQGTAVSRTYAGQGGSR
jgi:hypothetical protein